MKILHRRLVLATDQPIQMVDISAQVVAALEETGIREGLVTVLSPHTTGRINLNEREELLERDMVEFLGRLAPAQAGYGHDRAPVDGRENAHAHLLGLLMSAGATVPIADGRLLLGGWQSVFFVELDGPRPERHVDLHFLGR